MSGLHFYFDYRSPYAYLAHSQIISLPTEIHYRPFEILKLMQKTGNVPTSVICKPKSRYIQADLQRWVTAYNVPFRRRPYIGDLASIRLLRATLWAARRGPVGDVVAALFAAVWGGEGVPLETPSDVAQVLRHIGIDDPKAETEIDEPFWEEALEKATNEAVERGVFGAPCMFVGDEMFFGNDRLDFVRAQLGRSV
jgi:2-hydroxychromene-2-carboxylate isomerase